MRISDLEIQMSNLKEFRSNIWKYGFSTNNLYDVIIGLQIILGNIDPSTLESYVLDYNQDGSSDVLDIVEMVNLILYR